MPENPKGFFDTALDTFLTLGVAGLVSSDGPVELIVDICLSGTDHLEQYIQHRASSLLHELFWSHKLGFGYF